MKYLIKRRRKFEENTCGTLGEMKMDPDTRFIVSKGIGTSVKHYSKIPKLKFYLDTPNPSIKD